MKKVKSTISRKEFLKTSSAAFLGIGLFGIKPSSGSIKPANSTSSYNVLGRTEIKVSPIGFGASRTMEPTLVQAALDSGINFLDTGRSYYNGQNEIMVGKVIAGKRNNVVIQSKLRVRVQKPEVLTTTEGVKQLTTSMAASLDASLKALQTDYIDIMLIHGASSVEVTYHNAVMEFFESIKKKGIVRAHGFSSHSNQVELMRAANKKPFYDVIMIPYNHKGSYIHSRSGNYAEWDQPALEYELDKAIKSNMGLVAMKTCSGGPYAAAGEGEPSFKNALSWILKTNRVHTMAVAMANFGQIEENLKAMH